jgi:hypothetical protein
MSRIAVLNIVFTAVSTTSSTFARVGGAFSEVCCATAGVIATDWVRTAGSNSRRANASRAHVAGLSVGSPGPLDAANGLTAWMKSREQPGYDTGRFGGIRLRRRVDERRSGQRRVHPADLDRRRVDFNWF